MGDCARRLPAQTPELVGQAVIICAVLTSLPAGSIRRTLLHLIAASLPLPLEWSENRSRRVRRSRKLGVVLSFRRGLLNALYNSHAISKANVDSTSHGSVGTSTQWAALRSGSPFDALAASWVPMSRAPLKMRFFNLPQETLVYLRPTRYCEVDSELANFAGLISTRHHWDGSGCRQSATSFTGIFSSTIRKQERRGRRSTLSESGSVCAATSHTSRSKRHIFDPWGV